LPGQTETDGNRKQEILKGEEWAQRRKAKRPMGGIEKRSPFDQPRDWQNREKRIKIEDGEREKTRRRKEEKGVCSEEKTPSNRRAGCEKMKVDEPNSEKKG